MTARGAVLLLICLLFKSGCSTVEIVRLQPDLLHTPKGTEPIAGLQATCAGFYLFTLGIPEADLEKAVNELLMKEARKLGAYRVIQLRFDATPSHGLWFLTKLFWIRSATAWGIAVVKVPEEQDEREGAEDDEEQVTPAREAPGRGLSSQPGPGGAEPRAAPVDAGPSADAGL